MYKILDNLNLIIRISDGAYIPRDDDNSDYQQFKKDVVGIGTTCVEGSDIVTLPYKQARVIAASPPFGVAPVDWTVPAKQNEEPPQSRATVATPAEPAPAC